MLSIGDPRQRPIFCERVHVEEPERPYGNCDYLIQHGTRKEAECLPLCPYQRATHRSQKIWSLYQIVQEKYPGHKKEDPPTYGISSERWGSLGPDIFRRLRAVQDGPQSLLDAYLLMCTVAHYANGAKPPDVPDWWEQEADEEEDED